MLGRGFVMKSLTAEVVAKDAKEDEIGEQWDREVFFEKINHMTRPFGRLPFGYDADALIACPSIAGFKEGSFPGGRRLKEIKVRRSILCEADDTKYQIASYQIARINMAMKLLNVGATHGANYQTREDGWAAREWVVPVVLR